MSSGKSALTALGFVALFVPGAAVAGPTPCAIVNNVATCTLDQSQGIDFTTAPPPGTHAAPTGVSHVIVNGLNKPIAPSVAGTTGVKITFDMINVTPSDPSQNGFAGPATLQVDVASGQPINVVDKAAAGAFPTTSAISVLGRGGNGSGFDVGAGHASGGNGADGSAIVINNAATLSVAGTVVPVNRSVAFGLGFVLSAVQSGETRVQSALSCLTLADINNCTAQQKKDVNYFSCYFGHGVVAVIGSEICLGGTPVPPGPALVANIQSVKQNLDDQLAYLNGVPSPGENGTVVGGAIFAQSFGGNGGPAFSASANGGGHGGAGGNITINNTGAIAITSADSTNGAYTAGISAITRGGNGGDAGGFWSLPSDGVHGGAGGAITIANSGAISTSIVSSPGIFAQSTGGVAGFNFVGVGSAMGGAISVTDTGTITTTKGGSTGIFAQSVGGAGPAGGKAGKGGDVNIDLESTITTAGATAYGVYAASVGGRGGNGAGSGNGGDGGDAGLANILTGKTAVITTTGKDAVGLFAASLPGIGGTGGSDSGIFYADAGGGGSGGQGGNAIVVNNGVITTSGAAAYGIFAQALGGTGGLGGGAAALVASSGSGGGGAPAGDASVTNKGQITTHGIDAYGIYVQSVAGNGGDAGSSGGFVSLGSDGGNGAQAQCLADPTKCLNGGDVVAVNTGTITTSGFGADGIFMETIGGGGGNGGHASGVFTFGGDGGAGGNGGLLNATNGGAIITTGDQATGIFAQSVGGGGGNGGNVSSAGLTLNVAIGGSGGSGGMGGVVNVINNGTINDSGSGVTGIFAQSIGGGGGNGGDASSIGTVASVAVGGHGGGGGKGGAVTVINSATGAIAVNGFESIGIFAQSVGGGGGRGGSATSTSIGVGFAGSVSIGGYGADGGGAGDLVTVTNAGAIATSGDFSYAIFAQSVGGGGGDGGSAFSTSVAVGGGDIPAISASVAVGGNGGNGGPGGALNILNSGTITTLDWNSVGIFGQSVGGGGGNGGSSSARALSAASGLAISASVAVGGHGGTGAIGGRVDVVNTGSVTTFGDMSDAVFAQSIGGGGGNGGDASTTTYTLTGENSANVNVSVGGAGGSGNNGGIVNVTNKGAIVALGNMSRGVVAQSVGGGGGNGGAGTQGSLFDFIDLPTDFDKDTFNKPLKDQAKDKFTSLKNTLKQIKDHPGTFGKNLVKDQLNGLKEKPQSVGVSIGIGGQGGAGGNGDAVTVINTQSIITGGFMGFGIFAQSVGGGGGDGGGGDASGSGDINIGLGLGGASGGAGKGGTSTVTNTGDITTFGAMAYGIFAQSVGGGGGVGGAGGGESEGARSLSLSIGGVSGSAGNGDLVTVMQNGNIVTVGDSAIGVLAQSVGGGGGVGGAANAANYLNVSVGGHGGAGGNGGGVNVTVNGSIATLGDFAHGVFAQSVGGGGGLGGGVEASTLEIGVAPLGLYSVDTGVPYSVGVLGFAGAGGGAGNGGNITINTTGTISTSGKGADGIFAQSIGGGGGSGGTSGVAFPAAIPINGGNGGVGTAGTITIVHKGSIFATGQDANGIVAQSMGGAATSGTLLLPSGANPMGLGGNIAITVNGTISGGTGKGAGILISGGNNNTINNQGGTITALSGLAILGGAGNDAVENNGLVHGTVGLGGGVNSFHNASNGTFETGQFIFVNTGSTIVNDGTVSPFGTGVKGTTTMTGNFVQSATGLFVVDVNFKVGGGDLLAMDGTASLAGKTLLGPHHATDLVPNKYTTVLSAASITNNGISIDDTLVVDYGVRVQGNNFQIGVNSVNFVPAGVVLTPNEASIGGHLQAVWATGDSGQLTPLLDYLQGLTAPGTYATTLGSLDPGNGQPQTSAMLFSGMSFTNGLMSCPGTGDPADALHEHDCFWGRIGGHSARQSLTPTAVGYRNTGLRVQMGRQVEVAPNWFVGAALGYEGDAVDVRSLAYTSGKLYNAGVVAKYEDDSWTFAGAIDLTYGDSKLTRFVIFPTNLAAQSRPQSLLLDAKFRASDVLREDEFYLKPMIEADLYYLQSDGFHETGAGALNIIAKDGSQLFGSGGLGLEVGTLRKFDDGTLLRPYVSGGLTAFTNHSWKMMARFEGSPGGTPDFAIRQDFPGVLGRVTAGLEASLGEGTARFEFEHQFGSHYNDQSGSIKLEIRL